ncbi:MAG TPA: hypothetical protein VMA72_21375 [Streptosporangiaceae bacterium]|nr:hypothetical protein [Streptosporangiaceae bacterium]
MCTELQHRGFPAADLSPVGSSSGDPLGSAIVVSTTAIRSQLGTRLATVYAPVVIASFGTGPDLVQVRVTAAGSAAAYLAAIRADARARTLAGNELTGNRNIPLPHIFASCSRSSGCSGPHCSRLSRYAITTGLRRSGSSSPPRAPRDCSAPDRRRDRAGDDRALTH